MDLVNSDPKVKDSLKDAYELNRIKNNNVTTPQSPQPGAIKDGQSATAATAFFSLRIHWQLLDNFLIVTTEQALQSRL
jgi:hypothetical protein